MPADAARWSATPYSVGAADRIARELGLGPHTAAILVRRGHDTPESARRFLEGAERHDPFALGDMRAACDSILAHAQRGSPIVVHGDYDVDGVSSTAVMVRALRRLGARVSWHLPSRLDDGYGVSPATIERLAAEGAGLLVTVDCGITAAAEVERALQLGLDVVVTDHHRPPERLPSCPIVHPAIGAYPFPELCAAGVAHKLAEALYTSAGLDPSIASEDLDLVALATVADLVPLRDENRRLVREGLEAMARTRKPGLRALMKISSLDPGDVDARALAFRLAPRINAAGRLQRADAGLELLLTEDEDRAAQVADELDLLNRERQDTETRITFAAEAQRARHDGEPAYVLAGDGWHPGVIGIVASRIVERHHRPTLMIALDGEGGGRGSGRSVPAYDLHAGLAACSEHLRRFGGHRAAAGFDIDAAQVDGLRRAFVHHAAASLTPGDLIPDERIDALVPGTALGLELAEELRRLEPFGMGNPEPTLLVPAARVGDARSMGDEGQHARFTLSSGGTSARGVAFRTGVRSLADCGDGPRDVALRLELNRWNGAVEARVLLRALCVPAIGECAVVGESDDLWAALEGGGRLAAGGVGQTCRELRDRRGEGFAGVAAALLSSGESVLVVCADVPRRKRALDSVLGGYGATITSWTALAALPALAEPFQHLVALDPPPNAAGEALLLAAPASGLAHHAWGEPEVAFALALAQAELDLRPPLTQLYRGIRESGSASGGQLEALLRGSGRYPRSPALCARLIAALVELGLASYEQRTLSLIEGARAELERSPTYAECQELLAASRRYLSTAMPAARQAA